MGIVQSFVQQKQQQQYQPSVFDAAAELSLLPGMRHKVSPKPHTPLCILFKPGVQLGKLFVDKNQEEVEASQLQVISRSFSFDFCNDDAPAVALRSGVTACRTGAPTAGRRQRPLLSHLFCYRPMI
jgi:hypothetical protein